MYFKSVYTGQVFMVDFIPKFGGYELSTRNEYVKWCLDHRIDPKAE